MTLSPENTLHRAEQKRKAVWRPLYGWVGFPIVLESPVLDENSKPVQTQLTFPKFHTKRWSHDPGALMIGAPRRTNDTKRRCYVVWSDHSLRRITSADCDLLSKVEQSTRVALLKAKI